MSSEALSLSSIDLPIGDHWGSIYDVPDDLLRVTELYAGALRNDVNGVVVPIRDMKTFYEIYDGIVDQDVIVARVDDQIVGVASVDTKRQVPFFEGISVDPEYRRDGVASALAAHVIELVRALEVPELHVRSQPSSLETNRRIFLGVGGIDFEIEDEGEKYPRIVIKLLGNTAGHLVASAG